MPPKEKDIPQLRENTAGMKTEPIQCLFLKSDNIKSKNIDKLFEQEHWDVTEKMLSDNIQVKDVINNEKPDLVFLKDTLLKPNFFQETFPDIAASYPTYLISSSMDPGLMAKGFKSGAADCFVLPIETSDFLQRVTETHNMWKNKHATTVSGPRATHDRNLLWNTIPVLISYINRDHNFVEVNQKFLDVTGKKRKDVIGKSCFEVLPTQAAGYLKDDIEVMMTGQAKHNIIETINTGHGIQWIKTDKIPWRDKDNKVIGIIAYSFDITDVKSAEEAFKKSDEMLRQVLNTNPNPIFVKDKSGKFLLVNQAMADLFGVKTEQMIGTDELELAKSCHHMDLESVKKRSEEDARILKERCLNHEREESFILSDGSIKWFRTTTVPLPLGLGQQCLLGVSVDLTDRKNSEILMEKQAKALSFSNAELKQFAYVAAHDLQEPLRMVASYVQLLSRRFSDQLNEEANEYIEFAVEGAVRIHNLINDLLAYSQLNSYNSTYEPIDCNEIIQKVVHKKNAIIEEARATIQFESLPTIHADGRLIENVFENLIDNAIKFRNSHTPKVVVSSKSDDKAWVFSIQDNGIGFDTQFTDKIFSIFQKLKPKAVSPGTGIGLSICKKIVESHGGKIWVESSPGDGSTFYFSIPYPENTTIGDSWLVQTE